MTYSIAGRCPRAGMLGAVVATSSMAVGSRCVWGEAKVGVVLTQHRTDPRLGPALLGLLKQGSAPAAAIDSITPSAPGIGWRQLAVIDADGKGAVYNGSNITSIHNAKVGTDCAAAGNILRTPAVVDAMVATFEQNPDQPLPERLLRAIEAGHAAGGELKQVKSAALLVMHRESFPFVDLRVDLHAQPLIELRFLWELYQPTADEYVVRAIDPEKAPGPI
jgi:uncharacterized Ntn-hydrolase superfamily protein